MNRAKLKEKLHSLEIGQLKDAFGELTLFVDKESLFDVLVVLRDQFGFDMLIDITAVDYSKYGFVNWQERSQNQGFSRSKSDELTAHHSVIDKKINDEKRFAIVYHLLSIKYNHRLRIKTSVDFDEKTKIVSLDSATEIWDAANWFEREVFDMFGVVFINHPDLRRILTDYNFQDHPLRKDFPLIGNLEVGFDEKLERVVYKPVSIEERLNHPRVLRKS